MENKFYNELRKFKKAEKVELEKIDLAIFDDVQQMVTSANKVMETADKVLAAATKVNKAINSVTDDVKYYNKYRDITKDDLSMFKKELDKKLNQAEQKAKELGVDLKLASPNYERGKLALNDIDDVIRQLNNNTLEFDI